MIGLFDSGHGGLTIAQELMRMMPSYSYVYYGDHAHAPYGLRERTAVRELTQQGVDLLMGAGCRLVILVCNTATAMSGRYLQATWLPQSPYAGRSNVLGVIASTVEAATHVPWAVTAPEGQKKGRIGLFATSGTVDSRVYAEEIRKRCPNMQMFEVACPHLAGAIEAGASTAELEAQIQAAVADMAEKAGGTPPEEIILGCTHYELVRDMFVAHLPAGTEVLSQPVVVAQSLQDYIRRHPEFTPCYEASNRYFTSGDVAAVNDGAHRFLGRFLPEPIVFEPASRLRRAMAA